MPNPDIHLMLVSEQSAPNLLAALDPELKPKEAVLLVTNRMQERAESLKGVLQANGISTSAVFLGDGNDFSLLEDEMLKYAEKHEGEKIALNVTGGTKLMALAAQSVAEAAGWRIFYIDVTTDEIIWLGKNAPPKRKLATQIRLTHYLQGYGYQTQKGSQAKMLKSKETQLLMDDLVQNAVKLQGAIGEINWLAQSAETQRKLTIELSDKKGQVKNELLSKFSSAGLFKIINNTVHFSSKDALDFCKGGWLEQYVYQKVESLQGALGIRDKALNLSVKNQAGTYNEMDVAFMAKNRLFVIECKTSRMDGPRQGKANDALFKLAEISRRIGGLGACGLFVSYRNFSDVEKTLARGTLRLEVVTASELKRLDECLKTWVNKTLKNH